MVHNIKKIIHRKDARPKFIRVDSINKKLKGQDRQGIKQYNVLMHVIQINKECPESKEMEIELTSPYNNLCASLNDNNSVSDSFESKDSDSEDLEKYDGFAGGF